MTSRSNQGSPRSSAVVFAIALIAAVASAAPNAAALEGEACRIEVLVDGHPLTEYAARGTTYIEALRGREYEIRLTNLTDRRIAVALAVDGLNSIDAKTTSASDASKWVLGPHETTAISGWQTSSTHARRFFFTTEENSYGEWLGRTTNLGVIEAVVFREEKPRRTFGEWLGGAAGKAPESSRRARPSAEAESRAEDASETDDLAATGIGRRVDHRVRRVHLDLEEQPAAHIRLRYEYRPQLVHLGVLPSSDEEEALARRERATGFDDFSFAPDPFAGRR
jgi:hypothetical protein